MLYPQMVAAPTFFSIPQANPLATQANRLTSSVFSSPLACAPVNRLIWSSAATNRTAVGGPTPGVVTRRRVIGSVLAPLLRVPDLPFTQGDIMRHVSKHRANRHGSRGWAHFECCVWVRATGRAGISISDLDRPSDAHPQRRFVYGRRLSPWFALFGRANRGSRTRPGCGRRSAISERHCCRDDHGLSRRRRQTEAS